MEVQRKRYVVLKVHTVPLHIYYLVKINLYRHRVCQ